MQCNLNNKHVILRKKLFRKTLQKLRFVSYEMLCRNHNLSPLEQ